MNTKTWTGSLALATTLALLAGCHSMPNTMGGGHAMGDHAGHHVTLKGSNEVPANDSQAMGKGMVMVNADRTVKVRVTVSGMTATAAHIHEGAAGANGPVIVPLEKAGDDTFVSKADAKLTESQYAAFKAGNTYLNVHSAAKPGGEIRAQIGG